MTSPSISLVAWEERAGNFIFVAVPGVRGRYLRTDKSVALVACPHCESIKGEPCKSRYGDGYSGSTHFARRHLAASNHGHHYGKYADDVVCKPRVKAIINHEINTGS